MPLNHCVLLSSEREPATLTLSKEMSLTTGLLSVILHETEDEACMFGYYEKSSALITVEQLVVAAAPQNDTSIT